jgi:hypothetical protein
MDEDRDVVTTELGNGRVMFIEVRRDANPQVDVSVLERLPFSDVVQSIDVIASSVLGALQRAKPQRASVEFGIDVGVESGQLTGMLVKGSGSASLTVRLEWESPDAAAAPARPS